MLRPEFELRAAAPTFCNLPLMRDHVPISAATYGSDAGLVIGTVGSVHYTDPFLRGEICIWSQDDNRRSRIRAAG